MTLTGLETKCFEVEHCLTASLGKLYLVLSTLSVLPQVVLALMTVQYASFLFFRSSLLMQRMLSIDGFCFAFPLPAWTPKKTAGENTQSERKTWGAVQVASSREESKFNWHGFRCCHSLVQLQLEFKNVKLLWVWVGDK